MSLRSLGWGRKGDPGNAATINVGAVSSGSPAAVVNSGTSSAAVLDFTIPPGTTGSAASVSVGTTTTGTAGTNAIVSNSGSSSAAVLNFTIPRGNTGNDGPAGLSTVTPITSTRTLNSAGFQPSATKSTFVCYNITTTATNPLLAGTSTVTVTLLSDSNSTPTTERTRTGCSSAVTLTVTLQLTTGQTVPLCYIVPAGHYVRLVSTTTGTASAAITSQVEETFG